MLFHETSVYRGKLTQRITLLQSGLSAKTFCQNLLHLLRSLSWPGIGSGFRLQRGAETKLVVILKEEKEEVLESD